MTNNSEFTEVQTLDALIVNVQTADDIIAETLRNEVICATFSKTLKSPTFATLTQIERLERFFETFTTEAKADYVDDTSELERPLQASWRLKTAPYSMQCVPLSQPYRLTSREMRPIFPLSSRWDQSPTSERNRLYSRISHHHHPRRPRSMPMDAYSAGPHTRHRLRRHPLKPPGIPYKRTILYGKGAS